MRGLLILILLFLPVADAQSSSKVVTQVVTPHDFKGIRLGITIEEIRQIEFPDKTHGPAHLVCSDDPAAAAHEYFEVKPNADEQAVGITRCMYFRREYNVESVAGLNMGGGDYATYDYHIDFIKDPSDGSMRLFEIWLPTSSGAENDIASALKAKFGNPTSTKAGSVQNRFGAAFSQTTRLWSNAVSSLTVQAPSGSLDDMVVVYRLKSLADYADHQIEKQRSAKPDRM